MKKILLTLFFLLSFKAYCAPQIGLIQSWLQSKSFYLTNLQWMALFFFILASFILEKIAKVYFLKFIRSIFRKLNVEIPEKRARQFSLPFGMAVFTLTLSICFDFLSLPKGIFLILDRASIILYTLFFVVSTYSFINIVSLFFEKMAYDSENKFDDILVPLLRKTIKFFVVIFGIVFIGNSLTIDMKSLVAGLGIGGIAFALAAKDTISNLFGSLTVLLDKPFRIGDWVVIGDNVEGTVEEVGLRSTKVRTFYDSLITVPNGQLTSIHIDNFGRREYRRFTTKIGVQYDTSPEKIEAFCEGIRQIILKHKWTRKDYFHVYLNGLSDSSLNILLYVFWKVPDWNHELAEKHRLLVDIIRLAKTLEIEFAFPTRTLHMFSEDKTKSTLPENFESFSTGKKLATDIISNPLSMKNPRSGTKSGHFDKDKLSL